ncbi:MAG: aminodeoxychorismate/anthranilate synthase component II [Candidatus Hadarchaeum sp.]|uniref:anthranilate synthase component II n=1 Tax=Candidatus Hadarchaeum sp. TaxID=2883567 RepID=UPI003181FDB2
MKVVVIDNYDSFTYNLVHYIGELGAEPVVFLNDVSLERIADVDPERIIISPGPGKPKDAGISIEVIKRFGEKVPILGVCLGHQAIACAFGGRVVHAKMLMHGKVSQIIHNGSVLFRGIPSPFEATRYHSLAVNQASLPSCLRVTAVTLDQDKEIMGLQHRKLPIFGVQFHPESILTKHGKTLIKNFTEGLF